MGYWETRRPWRKTRRWWILYLRKAEWAITTRTRDLEVRTSCVDGSLLSRYEMIWLVEATLLNDGFTSNGLLDVPEAGMDVLHCGG